MCNNSDPFGLCVDGVTTVFCIEGAVWVGGAVAATAATYIATHPAARNALSGFAEASGLAMDWASIKRRLTIGGALVAGALLGELKDVSKVVNGVIRTEQEAKRKKKEAEDEQARKKKEGKRGEGNPDPPDKAPPE